MKVIDLGRLGYQKAWDKQLEVATEVIAGGEDTLLFVEHDPVLTLGANFHDSNLLLSVKEYQSMGIEVIRTDRGGDVTFHGPGQLVIYPIFDIKKHGKDLHKWMRDLEETIILNLHSFGLEGWRFPPHTGVWVNKDQPAKIAAIGVKIKKWVNLHGIALNVSNPLKEFDLIVPCGIIGYPVTSLERETRQPQSIEDAKQGVEQAFRTVFID